MKIVLILECQNLAFKKSRRIAAKYLNQIGSRTYMNDISQKALQEMHNELKSIVSKNSAIVCYRMTRTTHEIVFRMGSKTIFTEDGFFVYKNKLIEPALQLDDTQEFMLNLTEIAAIYHDVGKANKGFQYSLIYQKEKNSINSNNIQQGMLNEYRHELISFYIIYKLFFSSISEHALVSEKELIKSISEKIKKNDINNYLDKVNERFLFDEDDFFFNKKKYWDTYPVLNSILWLILTHHKLADSFDLSTNSLISFKSSHDRSDEFSKLSDSFKDDNSSIGIFFKNHKENNINNIFKTFDKEKFISLIDYLNSLRVVEKLEYIYEHYDNFIEKMEFEKEGKKDFNDSKLTSILTLIARPTLVYADYTGSSQKKVLSDDLCVDTLLIANTLTINNNTVFADTLEEHTRKVVSNIRKSLYIVLNIQKNEDFKNLSPVLLNDIYDESKLNEPEDKKNKFAWQDHAIKTILSEKLSNNAFFGVLMAGTGSGKTRACLKLAKAMSNRKLRLSVCLGLKTLSCQTKTEYTKDIFKDKADKDISLIVGSCLHNLRSIIDNNISSNSFNDKEDNELEELTANYNGSSNESIMREEEDDDFFSSEDSIELNNTVLKVLAKTTKDKVLINKPIVIMTIDNIIKAFSQESSDNLRYLIRVLSSDFVFDEIDDYSPKDLIAISSLIYMLGFFGRKVIISSATITQNIGKTLFDFYAMGVKQSLHNKKLVYGFINEHECEVNEYKNNQQFIDNYEKFTNYTVKAIDNKNIKKHSMGFTNFSECKNISDVYTSIIDEINKLHAFNYIKIKDEHIKFSVGFVKFNNVKESQEFSKFLDGHDNSDTQYAWINYHSNMINVERFFIEDFLDTYMKRKPKFESKLHSYDGSTNLLKNSYVKSLIEKAKKENKENVILVLNTTNIIEVGRDHDYDWAIIEPSSCRSVIQAIGRVKRHRDIDISSKISGEDINYKNVLIFDRFLKEVAQASGDKKLDYSKIMAYPGIQTDKIETKGTPLFSVKENFDMGSDNLKKMKVANTSFQIRHSLNIKNDISSMEFCNINSKNEYIFESKDYHLSLLSEEFIQEPSNKYLITTENKSSSFQDNYKNFRLLELDKFKQEFYLNSNIYSKHNIAARYYFDNKDNNKTEYHYITKITANFYKINKFRYNQGQDNIQCYILIDKKDIFDSYNKNLIINNNDPRQRCLYRGYVFENKKHGKIMTKICELTIDQGEYKNYFFDKKEENTSFSTMFNLLKESYKLKEDESKTILSMVELSFTIYHNENKNINKDYARGIGLV